jgi:hypothetical protein
MTYKIGGRIAFRHEGKFYSAYWALPDTMEGALLLGQIAMRFVESKAQRRIFMELIKSGIADFFEGEGAELVDFTDEVTAPEHERAGHG